MGGDLTLVGPGHLGLVVGPECEGGLALPYGRRVTLLRCRVAGTGYADLDEEEPKLQPGECLILLREPSNTHDPLAIRVLSSRRRKLGYVPADRNEVLARLMDAGKRLTAALVSKEWDGAWLHLEMEIALEEV